MLRSVALVRTGHMYCSISCLFIKQHLANLREQETVWFLHQKRARMHVELGGAHAFLQDSEGCFGGLLAGRAYPGKGRRAAEKQSGRGHRLLLSSFSVHQECVPLHCECVNVCTHGCVWLP